MRVREVLAGVAMIAGVAPSADASPAPVAVVNYRPDGRLTLLPVEVAGRREWFVLDTNAGQLVVDPRLSTAIGLQPRRTGSTTGTGTGAVAIQYLDPVSVLVGGVRVDVSELWAIDLSGVPISQDVRGLIGADLSRRFVVVIDPRAQTVALYDQASFEPAAAAACIRLRSKAAGCSSMRAST